MPEEVEKIPPTMKPIKEVMATFQTQIFRIMSFLWLIVLCFKTYCLYVVGFQGRVLDCGAVFLDLSFPNTMASVFAVQGVVSCSSMGLTWELTRHAGSPIPRRFTESKSAFEQDLQVSHTPVSIPEEQE